MKKQIGFLSISLIIVALVATACDTGPKLQSEVIRSERGGFEYQIPVGYDQEEDSDGIEIFAPGFDSDTNTGPAYYIQWIWDDEIESLEELQASMEEEYSHFDDFSTPKSVRVGGYPGLMSDFSFDNGNEMVGKMVVVYVSPTYQFTMLGAAIPDLWKNEIPAFYKILGTIRFSD